MDKRPNIIFILNDHQAYYRHGWDGGTKPLRPNFEDFARRGIEFDNAYTVSPMCGPARRSLLTGLYPHTHGQIHNENDPPYEHEVYLDTLWENGYKNYYYGKWHAGPGDARDHHCEGLSYTSYGNPYITDEYKSYLERKGLPQAEHLIVKKVYNPTINNTFFKKLEEGKLYRCEDDWCGEHAFGITVTPKETHEAFFLANLACDKLEELAADKSGAPFHLRVDFWGPHQPFFPTQEFIDMYPNPEDIARYGNFDNDLADKPDTLHIERNMPFGDGHRIITPNPVKWEEWQKLLRLCYAHGSMIDAAGGKILDKVRELGLEENTVIIWTTDHGDAIACQGGHFDKDSHMAQEVMRVPCALCWKDVIEPNQKSDRYVNTNDVPVTLLDAAGLRFTKNRVDGQSLLDLALKRGTKWRDAQFSETAGHGYGVTKYGRMIVKDDWKYCWNENDIDELYDLGSDPYELYNLAGKPEWEGKRSEMRKLLAEWQRKTLDPLKIEYGR